MKERLILKFELNRKQMINSNDRPHFHQKAKITKFLRQLAEYEGKNVLRDYFGLPCDSIDRVHARWQVWK